MRNLNLRPLDPQSVFDGTTLTVTCRAAFRPMPAEMPRFNAVAVRLALSPPSLRCKSSADCVPRCGYVVRPTTTLDLDTWRTDDHSRILLRVSPGQAPYFAGMAK